MTNKNKSLKDIRKDSGLKTNEILYKMDIQSSTLYSWENGQRLIPIDQLIPLLELYEYPVHTFDFNQLIETHKKIKKDKIKVGR